MIGSIIGDIAGAPYEMGKLTQDKRDYRPFFLNGLSKFTDDTNLTIAVADALMNGLTFEQAYLKWFKINPDLGYGSSFYEWAEKGGGYINESWGNGAAMRVSAIPLLAQRLAKMVAPDKIEPYTIEEQFEWALMKAAESTIPTHNCDEARNGAMAIVTATLLASQRNEDGTRIYDKTAIKDELTKLTGYDLTPTYETVRDTWDKRNCRCNITVPQALICFFESTDFEDCIRLAVCSGGDVDTVAAMAGGIAEGYYGLNTISSGILVEVKMRLKPEMIEIIDQAYGGDIKW